MLRACHRDTCKPGVATQRPHLRANFRARPRASPPTSCSWPRRSAGHLARIGARTLDEVIGRVELLRQRATGDARADAFDLHRLITAPVDAGGAPALRGARRSAGPAVAARRPAAGRRLPPDLGRRRRRARRTPSPTPTAPSAPRSPGAVALEYGTQAPRGSRPWCASPGTRRAELRRLPRPGRRARPHRRGQRLRRQGHGRRPHRRSDRRPTTPAPTRSPPSPCAPRCSPATRASTAPPAASCSWPAPWASASRCATRARWPWSRRRATTAAST